MSARNRDADVASRALLRRPGRQSVPWPGYRIPPGDGTRTHRQYADALRELVRESDSYREELESRRTPDGQPVLTPSGVAAEHRRFVAEELRPRYLRVAAALAEARQGAEQRARALNPARPLDPGDMVGALRRRELREHIARLPESERSRAVLESGSPELLDAVLELPQVTGLRPAIVELLVSRAIADRLPAEAAALADEHEAVSAVGDALRVVERELGLAPLAPGEEPPPPEQPEPAPEPEPPGIDYQRGVLRLSRPTPPRPPEAA